MNRVPLQRQKHIVSCLVEGMSMRATSRVTDTAINTVMSLAVRLGEACQDYQDKAFRELTCKRLQCDEIWSFVYSKEKNATKELKEKHSAGDAWTWTAIDPDTKLVPCWYVGPRNAVSAYNFMNDLSSRLISRVQMSTDGLKTYLEAVEEAFGTDIDYGMLTKIYGTILDDKRERFVGAKKEPKIGNPDPEFINTSYTERQNLTMRMQNRRLTRKTNGFSKKLHNHKCALALYFMYYNFARIHSTIRVTPAMEAGVSDRVWSIEEMLGLLDQESALKSAA